MATKISTEQLSELVINRVTSEEVYQNMVENGQVNEDELYFVEGEIDSLPSQAGNSGKFLTTDGTEASWADIPELGTIPRPNLLDNWYFVGGGSQQGGGQFPINQRGQTSYSATNLTDNNIDRWKAYQINITVGTDCLTLTNNGKTANGNMRQHLENSAELRGKTLTYSALLDVPEAGADWAITWANASGANTVLVRRSGTTDGKTLISATFTAPDAFDAISFYIYRSDITEMRVYAVKLELGDTQTLAHQENGVWVINEIPNYEEQKLRCASLIKTATGTIATNATSAAVSYTGTLLGAYAVMGGDRIETDMAVTASTVTFSTADYPDSAVTCTVIYM